MKIFRSCGPRPAKQRPFAVRHAHSLRSPQLPRAMDGATADPARSRRTRRAQVTTNTGLARPEKQPEYALALLRRRPSPQAAARALLWLPLLALVWAGAGVARERPQLSPAKQLRETGMVDIRTRVPDIDLDIRYAGSHNFVGSPIDGYAAPRCWLQREAADALARVEAALRAHGQRLRIFDCYRPARAVAEFVRWMADPDDLRGKAEFYPDLDKAQLSGVYIAPLSGHSRGATVDLTILQCAEDGADCRPLDMGTGFDFFGPRAHTDAPEVSAAQRANRQRLRAVMTAQGFVNLPEEWWHYRLDPEPTPGTYYDVPITASDAPVTPAHPGS